MTYTENFHPIGYECIFCISWCYLFKIVIINNLSHEVIAAYFVIRILIDCMSRDVLHIKSVQQVGEVFLGLKHFADVQIHTFSGIFFRLIFLHSLIIGIGVFPFLILWSLVFGLRGEVDDVGNNIHYNILVHFV